MSTKRRRPDNNEVAEISGAADTFYGALNPTVREELLRLGRLRSCQPREVIFSQGEQSTSVPLLLTGAAKLTATKSPDPKESLLEVRRSGDLLDAAGMVYTTSGAQSRLLPAAPAGELTDTPDREVPRDPSGHLTLGAGLRSATAVTLTESKILTVGGDNFARFMQAHPAAWIAAAHDLANRVIRMQRRLVGRNADAANRRLAEALLYLSLNLPGQGAGATIALTQKELATWVGVSTKTVEKILYDWRKRFIVATDYRAITIVRLSALMQIAEVPWTNRRATTQHYRSGASLEVGGSTAVASRIAAGIA